MLMKTYAFILGRKHQLAAAELITLFKEEAEIIDLKPEALIATFPEPLNDPQGTLDRIGGTIKIAEIFNELPLSASTKEIAGATGEFLHELFKDHPNKFSYGLSAYSLAQKNEIFLKQTLNLIKKELVAWGLKSRFTNHNFKNLENAAIKGEKLISKGAEIVIIQGSKNIFIGRTVALQDFEGYSHRDFDRPARDAKLGMLPPKLAQIMINFAGLTDPREPANNLKLTIYDPFVGVGTIPMEGLLMGFSVTGSDISPDVIEKCRKNTDWIIKTGKVAEGAINPDCFFVQDATNLSDKTIPAAVDAIVTESFLGPPMAVCPPPPEIDKVFYKISDTVLQFFKTIHPLIRPGTPVVISFPFYRRKDRFFFIEKLDDKIAGLGYKPAALIPSALISKFNLKDTGHRSLIYDRPDQVVGREIYKFIRK